MKPALPLLLLASACGHDAPPAAAPAEPASGEPTPRGGAEPTASDPAGETGPAQATAEPAAAPPPLVTLRIRLSERPERWAHLTIDTSRSPWRVYGCEVEAPGPPTGCRATHDVELTDARGGDYAALVQALRAMPRCEPVGFAPGDHLVELELGGDARRTWLPRAWLAPGGDAVYEAAGRDPCAAEQRLARFVLAAWRSG